MDLRGVYNKLTIPPTHSGYCSQIHQERKTIQSKIGLDQSTVHLFIQILSKPLLCRHDVADLNYLYCSVDVALRDKSNFSVTTSLLLQQVIDKVKTILKMKPIKRTLDDILSVYYLQDFVEDIGIKSMLKSNRNENERFQAALKMPFCYSNELFAQDVDFFIGQAQCPRISRLIEQKQKLLSESELRAREIETKRAELAQEQINNLNSLPAYLDQILNYGFLSLYLHLRQMRELPNRNACTEACEEVSFSELSRIIWETQAAITISVDEAIPETAKGYDIIFLLGGSGAGKSTTLSFLRGDRVELQGSTYVSKEDVEGIIGENRATSCTFLPNVEVVVGERVIVDFPGFDDSNGPYISLGMELALKRLVAKYRPRVIVLESITNIEGRYEAAARLGARLSRLFANKGNCVLGITKYSCSPEFIRLAAIEAEQIKAMSAPSPEEVALIAQVELLEKLVVQMPGLQGQLDEKRDELVKMRQMRLKASDENLPDTEEKKELRLAIEEKENDLKNQIGLHQVVRLVNLEKEGSLSHCVQALSACSLDRVEVNPKLVLESSYEKLLEKRFESGLRFELESRKDYHLDFEDFKQFKQKVFDTSLISAITPWSPHIGRFLHLPEMDEAIAKEFSKKIVGNCITSYIEGIIGELQLSKLQMLCKQYKKSKEATKLGRQLDRLINYLMGLKGLGYLLEHNPEKAAEEYVRLEKDLHQKRKLAGEKVEKSFELGSWAKVGLAIPIGIPLGIYKLVGYIKSENARSNAEAELIEAIFAASINEVESLLNQVIHLKEIEKIISKQEEIDAIFASKSLAFTSRMELEISIKEKINCFREVYGKDDWDVRVARLKDHISFTLTWDRSYLLAALLLDDSLRACVFNESGNSIQRLYFDWNSFPQFLQSINRLTSVLGLEKDGRWLPMDSSSFIIAKTINNMRYILGLTQPFLELDLELDLHRYLSRALLAAAIIGQSK